MLERIMQCFSDFRFTVLRFTLWGLNEFRYYIVFSRAILFFLGLAFSYSVVEKALSDILIIHLADWWTDQHLPKVAKVVNLHDGTYELLQIFFAYVAEAYIDLYTMIVCSTILYIIGLCLSYIASQPRLFYPALVLVTLSHAAEKVTLRSFLGDQLLPKDRQPTEEDKEKAFSRAKFWWSSVALLAAIVAFFGASKIDKFSKLSLVSAIGMGVGFLWFLLGTKFYRRSKPTGRPLSDVAYVIYMALIPNRNAEYPPQILPHVPWLRWLDRAAVEEQPGGGGCCSVEQVKDVKFLLKMLPIWATFLTFSLVSATGRTFFLGEATNIDDKFPVLFFIILQRFTDTIVAKISDYALEKLGKKMKNFEQRLMLFRIGIGMICCVLCCIAACINSHWLHLVKKYKDDAPLHTRVFRLIPQYFLLGVMEGLSEDGLENFFSSQVSESIARYGPQLGECVMGIGKFLSVLCILIFSKWFKWIKHDIDSSRLDKYYAVLAILSCLNLIIYWLVAYWYKDDRFLAEDQLDAEVGQLFQALQEDDLGSLVLRSLSNKGQYNSGRSLSSKILPIPEDSSFEDDPMEKQSETQEDSPPLLKTGQETVSSSSRSAEDGPLNGRLLSGSRSFPHPSSKGIKKRSHSIH